MFMVKNSVVLVVLDGVGVAPAGSHNAVALAHLPNFKRLTETQKVLTLGAAGKYVGLNPDQMGNSEVGHNTMGAGQIIPQISQVVDQAFASGTVFQTPIWQNVINNVKSHQSTLHFMGIFSDGKVHSDISHLEQMLAQAFKQGIARVRLHILTDGRDVPPQSEPKYIQRIEQFIQQIGAQDYKIASGGGRMTITADRYENDWGMVEKGWCTHVLGEATQFPSASAAVEHYRSQDPELQDQYLPPFVVAENDQPIGTINDGDSVVYLDFRSDRALEITQAFTDPNFAAFDRQRVPEVYFAGMTEYNSDHHIPQNFLVPQPQIEHPLPEYLAQHRLRQFAISETVKFGHITYYFNGSRQKTPVGEDRVEIPSYTEPFDTRPWMKCAEITDQLVEAINSQQYDFLRINYPGGDMVGHFGDIDATRLALEAIDTSIGRIIEAAQKTESIVVITADHGNAEDLQNPDGSPKTAHTNSRVPCIIADYRQGQNPLRLVDGDFGLANLAASITIALGMAPDPAWLPPFLTCQNS